jgi:sec-independent protein translocase protein TatB
MLGLGFTETIVLAGIILVVMGPEKFPEVAKAIIRTVRDVRGYFDDAQREITKEINPLKGELKHLSKYKPEEILDHMAGNKKPGEPTPVKKSPVEDDAIDPELTEPGLSGYGVKVPEPEVEATAGDAPHAEPYQPKEYNPYPVADEDEEEAATDSAMEVAQAEDKHELDDLSPPPRLEG